MHPVSILWLLLGLSLIIKGDSDIKNIKLFCRDLPREQVECSEPLITKSTEAVRICSDTQAQPCCSNNRTMLVECSPKNGVVCIAENSSTPEKWTGLSVAYRTEQDCRYVTGYDYRTALILSIFLGMFGIDRFYLGYYAIGLLKFCTFGFFLLGQLLDIILIATQTVGPADGSDYLIATYGPILSKVNMQNYTYYQYGSHYFKDEF